MSLAKIPKSNVNATNAEALNRGSFCRTLNLTSLREQLETDPSLHGMMENIARTRPNLFSSNVVFISAEMQRQITETVAVIERVAMLPDYQTQALARVNPIALHAFGPKGACMGYDFHLSATGPQLIEVNTNAGGLMLNIALARAQDTCCEEMDWAFPKHESGEGMQQRVFDMFAREWQYQRGTRIWRSLVIVDDEPQDQYLAPEFELFRQLFAQNGIEAAVVKPSQLAWLDGGLLCEGKPVDMVYNRLTDFYLQELGHIALRQAYESGAVVLTPHPRVHALLADKRNLIALSNDELLMRWGVAATDLRLLKHSVPATHLVTADCANELWARRRDLFFKPVAGYGAKAAYRGDKLTRRVWGEILENDFVAQGLVPPSERQIEVDGVQTDLKFDIRAYTYEGQVQLLAARMYAGQTTNFRTQGGGFAPVIVVPEQVSF